jgi:hypothetical protein
LSTIPQRRPFHSSGRLADKQPAPLQDEKAAAAAKAAEATPAAVPSNAQQQQEAEAAAAAAAAEQYLETYDPDMTDAAAEAEALPEIEIETDLVLPPTEVDVALREDELAANGAIYKPADSARGLEVVGGLGGWFERDEHWGPSKKRYAGFAPTDKVADPFLLELNVRRAVAEALAVDFAAGAAAIVREGREGGFVAPSDELPSLTGLWERGGRGDAERALGLRLEVAGDGGTVLADAGGAEEVARALRWDPDAPGSSVAGAGEEVGRQQFSADEAREIVQSWDQGWKNISLRNAHIKFAVSRVVVDSSPGSDTFWQRVIRRADGSRAGWMNG